MDWKLVLEACVRLPYGISKWLTYSFLRSLPDHEFYKPVKWIWKYWHTQRPKVLLEWEPEGHPWLSLSSWHTQEAHILYWKGTGLMLTFDLWHCSPNIHSLSQGNSLPKENCWPLAQSPGPAYFREIYYHKIETNCKTQTSVLKN